MFKKILKRIATSLAHYLYPYKIRNGEEQIFSMNMIISQDNPSYFQEKQIDVIKKNMIVKLADTIYSQGFATIEESIDKITGNKILSAKLICKKY